MLWRASEKKKGKERGRGGGDVPAVWVPLAAKQEGESAQGCSSCAWGPFGSEANGVGAIRQIK